MARRRVGPPLVAAGARSPADPAVLLVSADPGLGDRVAGLAQAAGVELVTVPDLAGAVAPWGTAGLVLLGADAMVARGGHREPAGPPGRPLGRRQGVLVVATVPPDPDLWRAALDAGAEQVVLLPDGEPWLLDQLVDAGSGAGRAVVLGVVGGRGGAGATTLATALAVTAAQQGAQPILVDLDRLGGGLDLVLGAEHDPGLRWPDLCSVRGRMQPGLLSRGLPSIDGVRLLSWGRDDDVDAGPQAVSAVLASAARESDLVVLDLPRRFDPAPMAAVQACQTVLLVVPAEVRAAAAAARVQAAVEACAADLRLVVRGPAPTGLTAEAIADSLQLPLAGELRPEPGLAVALDRGLAPPLRPRGSLATLCRRLTAELVAA